MFHAMHQTGQAFHRRDRVQASRQQHDARSAWQQGSGGAIRRGAPKPLAAFKQLLTLRQSVYTPPAMSARATGLDSLPDDLLGACLGLLPQGEG